MQSNKEFGERLKTLRKEHGKTQLDVAQRLGITPQAVSKWESGGSLPDCFNLQSLSELYGISLDTLLQIHTPGTEKDLAQKTGVLVQEYIHDHPGTPLFSLLSTLWKYILAAALGQEPADSVQTILPEGILLSAHQGISCMLPDTSDTGNVGPEEWELLQTIASPDGFRLLSLLHTHIPISKPELLSRTGLDTDSFRSLLLLFLENRIIEYVTFPDSTAGYRLHPQTGIAASLVLSAGALLAGPAKTVQDLSISQ